MFGATALQKKERLIGIRRSYTQRKDTRSEGVAQGKLNQARNAFGAGDEAKAAGIFHVGETGLEKLAWFQMLKKSVVKRMFWRSVRWKFLMSEKSQFCW